MGVRKPGTSNCASLDAVTAERAGDFAVAAAAAGT